ncbi:MAG: MerR family transcriptional regulator [Clostridia bacterium]|jgi:DNA-binding transcriptional MerR regulator|nr:MerR family transcriptional regulator [Clostridia bacterium]
MKTRIYSSKEFAIKCSITKKTLRHYNKLGLLEPSFVDENGYWHYDDSDMEKLNMIQSLKIIGLTLKEIKENLDSDFINLTPLIDVKLQFIDEQIEELETARRLLKRLKKKDSFALSTAVKESIEEDHLEWLNNNLEKDQLRLIEKMMQKDGSYKEHIKVMEIIKDFRLYLASSDNKNMDEAIELIKQIYCENGLSNETIKFLMTFLIKSSLRGPKHSRLISEKEGRIFLSKF